MSRYTLRRYGDGATAMKKIKRTGILCISIMIALVSLGIWGMDSLHNIKNEPDPVQANDLIKTLEEEGEGSPKVLELKERYGLEYRYLDGRLLVYPDTSSGQRLQYRAGAVIMAVTTMIAACFIIYHIHYMQKNILKPFEKMQQFAAEVAAGNLDTPLTMDRNHLFGAFTESFDLMREELAAARESERKANESKKELVASLSHDVKTPLASIKAMAEVLCVKTLDAAVVAKLEMINRKADQIEVLINNLFHATLEEIQELRVIPGDLESMELVTLLQNADFNHQIQEYQMQECLVEVDPLRLQQVFDNLVSNSYKYANTEITVETYIEGQYLCIIIKDYGSGVSREDLPLLKQKYFRGANSGGKGGAGIGLYISDYFMGKMNGFLELENDSDGFKAVVGCKLL